MQDLQALRRAFAELTPYGALLEVAMLVASLSIAYALVWLLRGARRGEVRSIWFGARLYDGVLFPLAALLAGVMLRWALKEVLPVGLLRLAVPILTALAVIRISVQVLRTAFPHSTLVRRLEHAGYRNLVLRTHAELDLEDQGAVRAFFAQEKPEYVVL
ncbi:MAG TPA: hypothetical protein PLB41_05095, partial [Rubrivivax sp.]|nr:hypothetical protein [Rubrivivax sp.]